MTYFTIYRQSRCPIFGTLCSNGLSSVSHIHPQPPT